MEKKIRAVIAAGQKGAALKEKLYEALQQEGFAVTDAGTKKAYYDAAEEVCREVQAGTFDRGILISATGQDMNILANKFTGIRSAICFQPYTAHLSRVDTRTNVLCLSAYGGRPEESLEIARTFLTTDYYGNNKAGLEAFTRFDKEKKKQEVS